MHRENCFIQSGCSNKSDEFSGSENKPVADKGVILDELVQIAHYIKTNGKNLEDRDLLLLYRFIDTFYSIRLNISEDLSSVSVKKDPVADFVNLSNTDKRKKLLEMLVHAADLKIEDLSFFRHMVQKLLVRPDNK
jgi:hypothetical protein